MADEVSRAAERGIVPGAVVQLKSGGPDMTVSSIETQGALNGYVYVSWFIDNEPKSGSHPHTSVDLIRGVD